MSISAFAQNVDTPPQPETIEGALTHVFKSTDQGELRLHVFIPSNHVASDRRAAVVFFFGGGWRRGSVEQFVPQSRHLAERGMVSIVADYRVSDRHGTSVFEAMADAKSAIRWVRSHARELGIDPNRIVASGGSSGGHLAASSAVFDGFDDPTGDRTVSPRPDALVLFNPALNLARAGEASPLHYLAPGLPPTVIFHGKADEAVPYSQVEQFCAESQRLDNQCQLFGYEGAPHGFFNSGRENGKWYRETLLEMDRFLTALSYLASPPPEEIE